MVLRRSTGAIAMLDDAVRGRFPAERRRDTPLLLAERSDLSEAFAFLPRILACTLEVSTVPLTGRRVVGLTIPAVSRADDLLLLTFSAWPSSLPRSEQMRSDVHLSKITSTPVD